jgi:hypothetical protein
MKILVLTSALLMAMNVFACGGDKDKPKEPSDERVTTLR